MSADSSSSLVEVHSVGVGREKMEMFGENPAADRLILSVNALGAAEVLSPIY